MSVGGGLLVSSLSPGFKLSIPKHTSPHHTPTPFPSPPDCKPGVASLLLPKLFSLAIAVTLNSPLPSSALPSLSSQPSLPSPTTPFSQSKSLQVGLENGKIRPCPSTNPGCVSTNPKSSSFAFPLTIPQHSSEIALQESLSGASKPHSFVGYPARCTFCRRQSEDDKSAEVDSLSSRE